MKAIPVIFSCLAVTALCLATPNRLRANDATNQPRPARPLQYSFPDANGNEASPEYVSPWSPKEGNSKTAPGDPPDQNDSSRGVFTPNQNQYPAPVNKAGSLIGMKVKNQYNETLGKIKDIVIDLQSGRVAYVVLEKAGRTHGTGANISVPLSAFTPSSDSKYLILNANKSQVQSAWGFSRNNYPPMGNPVYSAQAGREKEHIIIVPVPMSPEQYQDMNPDGDKTRDKNSDLSSF